MPPPALSRNVTAINAAKTHCVHGHLFTPENTYIRKYDGRVHRQCRACALLHSRKQDRDWAQRDRKGYLAYRAERNRIHRAACYRRLRAYLMAHPCVDCGESDHRVLEFDHSLGKKRVDVWKISHCAWSTVKKEMGKCEVRCANCHARRHYEERHAATSAL
jgi:hypothetical protein